MPKTARNYIRDGYYAYQRPYPEIVSPSRPKLQPVQPRKRARKKKKTNPIAQIVSLTMMALLGIYVIPYGFNTISKPLLFGAPHSEVKADMNEIYQPTSNYIYNETFLGKNYVTTNKEKPKMSPIYTTTKMPVLEANLKKLMLQYPTIQPSIFAWDYESGKYVDINGDKVYSAASIIKVPVLIQLFKSIEANQLTVYDEMDLTPYYKADGSGTIKNTMSGTRYTIDQLAKVMIQKSDNSATNMLMSRIGGMPDVNEGIREWGLKHTYINNWLPDLAGTNHTTAKDMATMLYNLDNPGFLNINSREYIIDYMSHVENNRLIQAGLNPKALFVHKTGDIGKMLGDAGIVFAPNGKKYIVVILANRPYNSPQGKNFIQKASNLIYNNITASGGY